MHIVTKLSLIILSLVIGSQGSNSGDLTVTAKARPGQVYVGQVLEITLEIIGNHERPKVVIPTIAGAEITLVGTELQPISTSAIGAQIFVRNLYRFQYRVVPRRAGTHTVPPFVATVAGNSVASAPLKLIVKALPAAGRTSDFLGGVGAFEVDATAEPSSVRRGRNFEYRITVRGLGAAGIHGPPALARLESLPLGLKIEKTSNIVDAEIPSHTFVYRIRTTMAGAATLPSVPISAFDPETQRYVTHLARGVPIRVTDVPGFDASKVSYPEPLSLTSAVARSSRLRVVISVSIGALLLAGMAIVLTRRKHSRAVLIRGTLRRQAERVRNAGDLPDLATAIMEGLVAFLSQAIGREAGALTPEEAEERITRNTGSAESGRVAKQIVQACDAVLYGGTTPDPSALRTQSLGLFKTLGADSRRQPT